MAFIVLLLAVLWLLLIGKTALSSLLKRNKPAWKELLIIIPFARLLERSKFYEHLQLPISSYHSKQVLLKGTDWQLTQTKQQIAETVGFGYVVLMGCSLLALLAKEPLLLGMGILLGLLLPLRPFMEAGRIVERRKQAIVTELPETLSKLMLLVGAGEPVLQAFVRCLEGKETTTHPLYKEWSKVAVALRNGESFSTAIERFNRGCAVQEVSIFTTVLLLNYRRGGDQFVLALREISYTLWEKRKAVARSRGEEASSKLVFPLVGILLVLMVFVAAPAMLLMS
ncbi:type II secretion system F family protein [Paenibacillus sp. YAF4_2]|uniref:type II secretion system F family protein n=1 Tax=Paenibacillus sp. YAF4_2 TaxID=3233085 RepID=UPI003F96BE2D